MRLFNDEDVAGKRVILRVDYNVPMNNNIIMDDFRIVNTIDLINKLLNMDCKIILLSHYGRVKTIDDKEKNSLLPIYNHLVNLLSTDIRFIPCDNIDDLLLINTEIISEKVILLENTRFYDLDSKLESGCSDELSFAFSKLGDVFINDAFGTSHRKHASNYGIKKYLPSFYGFLINKEIDNLNCMININDRPFTIFLGGAKVEDKLPIIKKFVDKCDYLCLGGGILNSFLKANGYDVKDSLSTNNIDILCELNILLSDYKNKIILSNDFIWDNNRILDIAIDSYKEIFSRSKLIFINGTPGLFENVLFQSGTNDLFNYLSELESKIIVGGGDTSSALKLLNFVNDVDFISSGGGATLDFIANGFLPALED